MKRWLLFCVLVHTAGLLYGAGHHVTDVRDVGFTVSWVSTLPEAGYVLYGLQQEELTGTAYDKRGASYFSDTHYVELTGLTPDTVYHYRIVSGGRIYPSEGTYTAVTGDTLTAPIPGGNGWGKVFRQDALPAEGAVVYIRLLSNADGASSQVISSVVDEGFWNVSLNMLRKADFADYFPLSDSDRIEVFIQGGAAGGKILYPFTLGELKNEETYDFPDIYTVFTGRGDINFSGTLNISDVMLCLRMSVGLDIAIDGVTYSSPYNPFLFNHADVNNDGAVNISDVILILRQAIGLK